MASSLISVIIPAFNAARTLADTVASVRRQAANMEIIIVDDGSTDATRDLGESFGEAVRCVHQENAGAAAARNAGFRLARGELIAFLDADDEWPDGGLALLAAGLNAHPEWSGVQGRTAAFISSAGPMIDAQAHGAPWHGPMLGSALFRREALDRVGGFDQAMAPAEDLDWFVRARECGAVIGQLADVTLHYRLHAGSLTGGLDPVNRKLMVVLRQAINRRKTAASSRDTPA